MTKDEQIEFGEIVSAWLASGERHPHSLTQDEQDALDAYENQ